MSCCGRKPVKRRSNFKMRKFGGKNKLKIQKTLLKTLAFCQPDAYFSHGFSKNLTLEQWANIRDRAIEHSADVLYIASKPSLPFMTFASSAGLPIKGQNLAVLSRFKDEKRVDEEQWYLEWFLERGYGVQTVESYFDSSDALYFNNTLIGGYGASTDISAYDEIRSYESRPIVTVQLIGYHLNQAFCPLSGPDYLIFPNAFDEMGLNSIRALGTEIVVSSAEAKKMACNAICIGRTVLLPLGCPETKAALEQKSYEVVEVDVGEFLRVGQGCKSLVLEL